MRDCTRGGTRLNNSLRKQKLPRKARQEGSLWKTVELASVLGEYGVRSAMLLAAGVQPAALPRIG
jgi:hypothetical protein